MKELRFGLKTYSNRFGFGVHLHADDTQFNGSFKVSEAAGLAGRAVRVVNEIKIWMSSNRLRLSADKTQFIWLGTGHFLGKRDMQAIDTILSSTDVVNNLGVYLDSELTLERQVSKLCQVCYFHLRRLRTVRRSLSKECLRTLVHAFVTSRVDYSATASFTDLTRIFSTGSDQYVRNSAARLLLNIAKFSGISAAIRDALHWLPIRKRIEFKIVLLVRHCLVGDAPEYLMELCRPVSSAAGRQSLRSASRGDLIVPRFRLRTFSYRAFAVSGPQLWNSLPLDVRQSRDNLLLQLFKNETENILGSSSSERFCGSKSNEGLTSTLPIYYQGSNCEKWTGRVSNTAETKGLGVGVSQWNEQGNWGG